MRKLLIALTLAFTSWFHYGQDNRSWGGYFSYNHAVGLTQSPEKVIAGTENALFTMDTSTNELATINAIDGLKSESITAVYHSSAHHKTLVGNSNGLLLVVDTRTNRISQKVDIISDVPVVAAKKRINRITEADDKAYIATDYGISVLDLQTLEFGDTYFIGESGQEIRVLDIAIVNNQIYAATADPYLLRSASLSNPFLVHYNSWETSNGAYSNIENFNNRLVLTTLDGYLQHMQDNGTISTITHLGGMATDLQASGDYLSATMPNSATVFATNYTIKAQIGQFGEKPLQYTAGVTKHNYFYLATTSEGVFRFNLENSSEPVQFLPAGPLRNKVYSIKATTDELWCVFGDNSATLNPYFPDLGRYGISKFSPEGWIHIPYEDLGNVTNLSDIAVHPSNAQLVYFGSNINGILKVENNQPTANYNSTNTGQNGLQGFNQDLVNDVRVHSLAFDKSGTLWASNSGAAGKIVKMQSGNWTSYTVAESETHIKDISIDKNGTKWMATVSGGVIGFNEAYQNRSISITTYDNGLPYSQVLSVAVDLTDRLWIGTLWGIRVLPSVDRFLTEDQPSVNPVIIMEDGLAQELLYRQPVSKIKVDGANQKWIGTLGSGLFLVSSNGQQTIHHFTKDNSPLPSNQILDIDINPKSGEVFIATDKGMVSYKGASTQASDDLGEVYVYPNPVRPEFAGTVKIAGLTDKANVKITDIEGNLVFDTISKGGTVEWDTTAFGKYRVASGVYMIFITSESAEQTKVKKVMIIR